MEPNNAPQNQLNNQQPDSDTQPIAPQQPVVPQTPTPGTQPIMTQPTVTQTQNTDNPKPYQANSPISNPPVDSQKDFMTTAMLSLFLGGFGVDRFYLGKTGTGILKLLTIGGLGIWYYFDLIMILVGKTKSKNGQLLGNREKNLKLALIITAVIIILTMVSSIFNFRTFMNDSKEIYKQDNQSLPTIPITAKSTSSSTDDDERKTDIKAIDSAVGYKYSINKYYPSLENINDPTYRSKMYLDEDAYKDPRGSTDKLASSPSKNVYSYQVKPVDCDNVNTKCTSYLISATLNNGTKYELSSN